MNIIKLDANTNLTGYRVMDLDEFKSCVSLAGVFTRIISVEDAQQKFFEQLVDHCMKSSVWEDFVSHFSDLEIRRGEVFDTLREYIEYPESIEAYSEDCFIELDTINRGLYYIEDHTPDYSAELDKVLPGLIDSITELVNEWKAEAEQELKEQAELEEKKQSIIRSYKAQYNAATTSTAQSKVVDECKIILKQTCGITQTKAEVVYMLTH